MAKKIFIAGTGQNCGKTTLTLALMHLAKQKYRRVGFMKPIGPKMIQWDGLSIDMDALLIARVFGLEEDLPLMSPVAFHRDFTRDFLSGKIAPEALRGCICAACDALEEKYDLLIMEGAGHGGVGSVINLNNAQVAAMLETPVLMVTEGGIGSVVDSVCLNQALYRQEEADLRLVMMNKLAPSKRDMALSFLRNALAPHGLSVGGAFNISPVLANPTLVHVANLLGLPVHGDPSARRRIIFNIQLGAASSQKVIDGLAESTLLIVTSSRDELIVTLSSLYHIPEYREKIAGVVISGHVPMSPISQQILEDSMMPYIRIEKSTSDVYSRITEDVAKMTPEDQEKIDWIQANAENHINFSLIDRLF